MALGKGEGMCKPIQGAISKIYKQVNTTRKQMSQFLKMGKGQQVMNGLKNEAHIHNRVLFSHTEE
jgi:hypothetical protein